MPIFSFLFTLFLSMSNPEIAKIYEPGQVEEVTYTAWEQSGFFAPEYLPHVDESKEPFSIVLPPPNVTGTLHMGHAAMLAIEDAMVRFARLQGRRTVWIPGTDHAAIATQSKVEGMLFKEEGKTRHDLGREAFLQRVHQFAQQSHDTIVNQSKKMGASLDWNREAYTLDKVRNRAVNLVFKQMYEDGLIYRGHRIVNWDPVGQTVISDDEIVYKEEKTKFYYFSYGPFEIGTARPETKFGDKYIIVHPDDERYANYAHGQKFLLEWINGPIEATLIKDEAANKDFGTGAMTITPWHSVVDFDLAEKYSLDKEQIIGLDGRLLSIAGEFAGMPILEAREKIVQKIKEKGLLVRVEEGYIHNLATAERSGAVVEPQILHQWFIGVNRPFTFHASEHAPIQGLKDGQQVTLKELMQHVVRSEQIKILPERFEKTYFHWIDHLRDWNISRQIWFGHQIPVRYCDNEKCAYHEKPILFKEDPIHWDVSECPGCQGKKFHQDPDTFDTWFSSGLWTFSTLLDKNHPQNNLHAWANASEDFQRFHPTSVLETGYDIIFFWVARMILLTTYVLGEIPFKTAYFHGLVRDDQGRKMSKSLGNIINPLDMIQKYGADATRLSLIIGSTPGNDLKMSEEKIAGYRNFTNKLWNISRFVCMTVDEVKSVSEAEIGSNRTLADAWILFRYAETVRRVTTLFEQNEFSAAGELLREFTWADFADWYVEIAKIERQQSGAVTDKVLLHVLEGLLTLWHPFMPFVTEEIWKAFGQSEMLIVHTWPRNTAVKEEDVVLQEYFSFIREFIVAVRNLRAEHTLPPGEFISLFVASPDKEDLIRSQVALLERLARVKEVLFVRSEEAPKNAVTTVLGSTCIFIPISVEASERERVHLENELQEAEIYLVRLDGQLANEAFVSRAPETVVVSIRDKRADTEKTIRSLREQLGKV